MFKDLALRDITVCDSADEVGIWVENHDVKVFHRVD